MAKGRRARSTSDSPIASSKGRSAFLAGMPQGTVPRRFASLRENRSRGW
jgi:hypothetical protein